jgi:hypothetical protein
MPAFTIFLKVKFVNKPKIREIAYPSLLNVEVKFVNKPKIREIAYPSLLNVELIFYFWKRGSTT